MTIILADIGGTHARFACEEGGVLVNSFKLATAAYPSFTDALAFYTQQFGYDNQGDLYLAVAAHDDGQGNWKFSNHNQWVIRPAELARLGWNVRTIVMDFLASARGALALPDDKLVSVKAGQLSTRPKAILGPGTGLGLAFAFPLADGTTHIQETYGGRMLMAAVTDEQSAILRVMHHIKGPGSVVECEDVVSGRGLPVLYRAVCEHNGRKPVFQTAEQMMKVPDDADVADTLRLFHEFLGIFMHHVAISGHAYGGIYIDGGMIQRLRDANLFDAASVNRYFDLPGAPVVERDLGQTPIWLVNDPYVALTGLQELKNDA